MTKVIYICGSGRSGSTILDVLLAGHKNISGLGEVHRLSIEPNKKQCGCGLTKNKCLFWRPIINQLQLDSYGEEDINNWNDKLPTTQVKNRFKIGPWFVPDLTDLIVLLSTPKLFKSVSKLFNFFSSLTYDSIKNSWTLFDTVNKLQSTPYIVDSSKNALRGKLLYLLRPGDVYFIHIIRDGRAIASSAKKRGEKSILPSIYNWVSSNKNVERILLLVPRKQKILIGYEHLCKEPEKTMSTIFDFIGLQKGDWSVEEALMNYPYHQIPGNPLLANRINGIRFDESWKNNLTNEELSDFERVAGEINKRYGFT